MVTAALVTELLTCKTDEERLGVFQSFALKSIQDGILITERDGADNRIVCVNPAFEQMCGYTHKELIGRDCRFLQGPDTDAHECERLGQAIARSERCSVTLKNYRQDGSAFWNEISIDPVHDGRGPARYFVGIMKDVSEHHNLQERERQLGRMLAQSPNEIYTVGADDFRFLWANESAISGLGYSMAELRQMTPMDISRDLDERQIKALIEPLMKGTQEQVIFKAINKCKDGSYYPVEVYIRRAEFDSRPGYVAVLLNISEREAAETELREAYEDLRHLSGRLLGIRDEERQRLARDMHDDIAQSLAAIKIDLTLLKSKLADRPEGTEVLLNRIQSVADRSVVSIRRMLNDLRPAELEDTGLFGGIEILADEIGHRYDLQISFSVYGQLSRLPDSLVTPVYRLIQESLNNVGKHAQATKAEIELIRADSGLTVRVRDDGIGLQAGALSKSGSFGLAGMRERVSLLGGEFTVSGAPGQGTEVEAVLPILFN